MESLLTELPKPTTGGEHPHYDRGLRPHQHPASATSVDAAQYPGTPLDDNDKGQPEHRLLYQRRLFIRRANGRNATVKMTRPCRSCRRAICQITADNYDNVFLSVSDAEQVIDAGTMVPWYAGAARMDAGLTITERLASIAKAHKVNR